MTFQQKLKAGEEQKKQAEIEDLQKQLQQLREMNAGKAVRLMVFLDHKLNYV